ncbi:MAG: lipopolysaccharide biosynthesis protein, partial [Bacteroidia bacterium]
MSGGQIARQSFWASVVNYSGSLLGLFTTFYVFPLVFSPSELGVTRLFIEMGALLAAVAQLGTGYSIWKFFPRFRSSDGHHGVGFWLLIVPLMGCLLVAGTLLFFQDQVLGFFGANADQIRPYYIWLLPFVFVFVYNTVFETFSASLGHIIFPSFLRENGVRMALAGLGFLYYLKIIDFAQSLHWIPFVYGFVAVLNLGHILRLTRISFFPDWGFVRSQVDLGPEFTRYTLYFFLTTVANLFVQRLDLLMVSSMKGWDDSGIYAIAINMAVLVEVPTRSILQVANPKLSEALHANNQSEVQRLYTKTSLNQFLLGLLV